MELRPCTGCKRHVKISARTCPFCAVDLPAARAQYAKPIAFTRAAIFSAAALTACSEHKAPAPAQGSAHAGSGDDLENLLDEHAAQVDHPAPVDAQVDAAAQVAAADAGVAPDAGVDPKVAEEKRRELLRKKMEAERRRQEELLRQRQHIMNKPYGAPPARRRIV